MGFKDWILKRAINGFSKELSRKSSSEISLDDYLKNALKRNTESQRMADKMLKVKLVEQSTKSTLDKIQELTDEDYEDDEPVEDTLEDKITNALIQKFLGNPQSLETPKNLQGIDLGQVAEVAKNLTPDQINDLKEKFLGK